MLMLRALKLEINKYLCIYKNISSYVCYFITVHLLITLIFIGPVHEKLQMKQQSDIDDAREITAFWTYFREKHIVVAGNKQQAEDGRNMGHIK